MTLLGIVMLSRPVQPLNALLPIEVTLFGITILNILLFENPLFAIAVTGGPLLVTATTILTASAVPIETAYAGPSINVYKRPGVGGDGSLLLPVVELPLDVALEQTANINVIAIKKVKSFFILFSSNILRRSGN